MILNLSVKIENFRSGHKNLESAYSGVHYTKRGRLK